MSRALPFALGLFASFLTSAGLASAAEKFLDGAYGNEAGCVYANTGESSGSDDFFLLTDEGITTAVSYCTFTGKAEKTAKGFAATVSCEEEGGNGTTIDNVQLEQEGGAYTIAFPDTTRWGPFKKCR